MVRKALLIFFLCGVLLSAPFAANAGAIHDDSGTGYYYWDDGTYYGQLKNGIPSGYGTGTYMNGETYKGQWSNGLMNGQGAYSWPDGKLYTGSWKDGHMNGQGLMIYSDGSTYSGEFYQDRPTGKGESADGGIRVVYNNQAVKFDVNPFTAFKRIMVPVRGVFEAAGAQIGWDPNKQMVMIEKGSTSITLIVDSVSAQVNGRASELEVAPMAYRDRVFVPLRFVAENLGGEVAWDAANRVVWMVGSADAQLSSNVSLPSWEEPAEEELADENEPSYSSNEHFGPRLSGWESDDILLLSWSQVNASDFSGYKVVISASDSSPCYPDNGYLFYITDRSQTSCKVDNSSKYHGGDFGGYLQPGQSYYFSITALYANEKLPGNVITLVYPD